MNAEYALWAWIIGIAFSEYTQSTKKDFEGYFSHFSNRIDLFIVVSYSISVYLYDGLKILHLTYMLLRWTCNAHTDIGTDWVGAVNVLIVACVISWVRLMAFFPVNSTFVRTRFSIVLFNVLFRARYSLLS